MSRTCFVTLLDLINIADKKGNVQIYYKDLINTINCSTAQFYNVLNELERTGIIKKRRNNDFKNEIDITIIGNDFSNGYKKGVGYVNTNRVFFSERHYKNMKAGEIKIYLYILFRVCKQKYNEDNDRNRLRYNYTYKTIANQLNMSERMTKKYCKSLDDKGLVVFGEKISLKEKKYDVVTLNKKLTRTPVIFVAEKGEQVERKSTPLHLHWCHYIKNLCRRYKKNYDIENLNNTALLFNQYKRSAEQKNKDIYAVLSNAIRNLKEDVLNSKVIHIITRELIKLDYDDSIIVY